MKAAEIVREPLQDCPNGPVTAARRPPCRAAGRIVQLAAARQTARLRARHGVPSWASSSSQIIAAGDELEREARAPAYLKLSAAFSPPAQSPRPARPPAVRVRADGYFSALRGELHSDFQSAKRHRAAALMLPAAAQWERTPMPCHPWAHGGYFAPATRYAAQAAFTRTQPVGFRSTLHGDRRSDEEKEATERSSF